MGVEVLIRDEHAGDEQAIAAVTTAAFETLAISAHTEQFIVAGLRAAGALTVSLVAEVGGRVVGHVAFSPVKISDGAVGWYGLGPVSVVPTMQRQGIGGALIRAGLARLRALGARGCCLVGHPAYYPRFGFGPAGGVLAVEGVPAEVFQVLVFAGGMPTGLVVFHEAFNATC